MHAFLITQSTSEDRFQFTNKLISDRGIEVNHIFKLIKSEEKKSIGIEDTKELKKWIGQISTKPRAALIEEAQLLTIPAQQSLLKVIEEPGDSAIVILTADAEMSLLPTVRSRCKIVRLKSKIEDIKSKIEKDNLFSDFLFDKGASGRILWLYGKLSEFAGKKVSPHQGSIRKETGVSFIEQIIEEEHIKLENPKILDEAAKVHRRLKQNISPMLTLQEFALNI